MQAVAAGSWLPPPVCFLMLHYLVVVAHTEPSLHQASPGWHYDVIKRAMDLSLSVGILVVLAPLWLIIGVAIRATSPGPAIFRRVVVGKNGRRFVYLKFRTMLQGDDSHHIAWLRDFVTKDASYDGRRYKVTNDHRITRLGQILRRTSLDEIPQLVNVIRGDMSIVGPRPPIEAEYELYDAKARRRLDVLPGITGLYQVTARSSVPFSQMLMIDLDYISRRSTLLDVRIMVRTVVVVLLGRGAG